ncbi:DUF2971 domain-containing protein [Candidatus Microgenomates bacterium]|nr:DUF2971 domain-containing protein [Candidatus Microgenomates bacterium]
MLKDVRLYYHFLSAQNAVNDLERKMIRVSTLDTLNDPFELLPYLRYPPKKRKPYNKLRKRIADKWGLLCFSKTWQEPLLWSHYADKHKGIALGFEIIQQNKIVDVIYSDGALREQIELTDSLEDDEMGFLDLARLKYKKWEYEQEARMLIKLNDCTKIGGNYFISFGNNLLVKTIRLGSKYIYENTKNDYILTLSKRIGAEIIPCRLEWQGYSILKDGTKSKVFQTSVIL